MARLATPSLVRGSVRLTRGPSVRRFNGMRKHLFAACVGALDEKMQDAALLIGHPPEVMPLAIDREEDLTRMPCIPWSGTPVSQRVAIVLAECAILLVDSFIGDDHAALEAGAARQAPRDKT